MAAIGPAREAVQHGFRPRPARRAWGRQRVNRARVGTAPVIGRPIEYSVCAEGNVRGGIVWGTVPILEVIQDRQGRADLRLRRLRLTACSRSYGDARSHQADHGWLSEYVCSSYVRHGIRLPSFETTVPHRPSMRPAKRTTTLWFPAGSTSNTVPQPRDLRQRVPPSVGCPVKESRNKPAVAPTASRPYSTTRGVSVKPPCAWASWGAASRRKHHVSRYRVPFGFENICVFSLRLHFLYRLQWRRRKVHGVKLGSIQRQIGV